MWIAQKKAQPVQGADLAKQLGRLLNQAAWPEESDLLKFRVYQTFRSSVIHLTRS
jgi:hypothetical protein